MSRVKAYRRTAEELIPDAWYRPWTPTEAEFTRLFLRIARAKGWTRRYHTHDSRRSTRGFPDWVLVHTAQRRILFVELKGFAGTASDEQREWMAALDQAGAEAYIVTTSGDFARDAASLAELLTAKPRRTVGPAA
jgi:hypothetical protein